MRIQKVHLKQFKRFDDLTIDLGDEPRKIIALVGPNGCGKSSIFDAFEASVPFGRPNGQETEAFWSKALYSTSPDITDRTFNKLQNISITPKFNNLTDIYIRTAYRFSPRFNVRSLESITNVERSTTIPKSTIALDSRLEENYKRLINKSYQEFDKGDKTGGQVKDELIGKTNAILKEILNIEISSLGSIIDGKGQIFFRKESSSNFPYSNLSAGEKEVIDIILDLIIKVEYYKDTVYCIDEPELHLNTAIQRKLLVQIEKIIPDNCQLWIATHSIGFLRALQDELKDKSQILDFSEGDYFNGSKTITPMKIKRSNWQRIFSTALEDLTGLISPRRIVYCEGRDQPTRTGEERGLDAKVYNLIFNEKYHDTLFVSSGGNTELDHRSEIAFAILSKVFSDVEIIVLKDRDFGSGRYLSEEERSHYLELNKTNHRMLIRWEIENYLFDKEILKLYCADEGLNFDEEAYNLQFPDVTNQDLKEKVNFIRNFCNIKFNINPQTFKLKLAEYVSEDTKVYQELERIIMMRQAH